MREFLTYPHLQWHVLHAVLGNETLLAARGDQEVVVVSTDKPALHALVIVECYGKLTSFG